MKKETPVYWNPWTHNVINHCGKMLVAPDGTNFWLTRDGRGHFVVTSTNGTVVYTTDDNLNMSYFLNLRELRLPK